MPLQLFRFCLCLDQPDTTCLDAQNAGQARDVHLESVDPATSFILLTRRNVEPVSLTPGNAHLTVTLAF